MNRSRLFKTAISAVCFTALAAFGQIPRLIPYQGVYTDTSGNPKPNANYSFTFSIYDVASTTTPLWSETRSLAVKGGLFNTYLGEVTAFPSSLRFDKPYWLGIKIGAGAEMVPRISLGSSAYSISAERAGNAAYADTANVSLSAINVWSMTGNSGTVSGTHFLGTFDNVPFQIRVNNTSAMTYLPSTGTPNILGGHAANAISAGVRGGVVAGGGDASSHNQVTDDFSVVGGGAGNQAGDNAGAASDRAYATVGGGNGNQASGSNATVGGGGSNTASAIMSTIAGGFSNAASGNTATISGGSGNVASFTYSVVGGGYSNNSVAFGSTVGGGYQNRADFNYATVGGGQADTASGINSTVGGGKDNRVNSDYGAIGGGLANKAGSQAVVSGGTDNNASGGNSNIGGGWRNRATNIYAAVLGGQQDTASGPNSMVGGGYNNVASGTNSVVAGGYANHTSGSYAGIITGAYNNIQGTYGVIGGGYSDTIFTAAQYSTIGGGYRNKITGDYSTIGGGYTNTIAGNYSSIPSGRSMTVNGNMSFASGYNGTLNGSGSVFLADSSTTLTTVSADNRLYARFNNGYVLYTKQDLSTYLYCYSGGTAWSSVSDSNRKENFRPVDGEAMLQKLDGFRVGTWNYKGQDKKTMRHYGVMAQDLYAAYGHDGVGLVGNDTSVNTLDMDGVNFSLITALEKRTRELKTVKAEVNQLKEKVASMEAVLQEVLIKLAAREQKGEKVKLAKEGK